MSTWSILASPSMDSQAPAYIMTLPQASYIFNVPEGFKRHAIFATHSLKRTKAIFLQSLTHVHAGGLPGILIDLADTAMLPDREASSSGTHSVILATGSSETHLNAYIATYRDFASRHVLGLKTRSPKYAESYSWAELFVDEMMTVSVWNGARGPQREEQSSLHRSIVQDMFKGEPLTPETNIYDGPTRHMWHERLPRPAQDLLDSSTHSYKIQLHPVRGTFSIQKADALGMTLVERGALMKQGDMQLANGKRVKREEVCDAPSELPCVGLIHLNDAQQADEFSKEALEAFDLVFLTYARDLDPQIARDFTKKFEKDCQVHGIEPKLVERCSTALDAYQWRRQALTALHPGLFPAQCQPQQDNLLGKTWSLTRNKEVKEIRVERHRKYEKSLADHQEWQRLDEEWQRAPLGSELPMKDVQVIALGTGASAPSKYRNVSGTLLNFKDRFVLCDCGESTANQLATFRGIDYRRHVLQNLHLIFISHIHADHHVGLSGLLAQRKLHGIHQPLYVITRTQVRTYIKERADMEDLGIEDVHWVQVEALEDRRSAGEPSSHEIVHDHTSNIKALQELTGFSSIQTAFLDHREPCHAIIIRTPSTSITFLGDTRPTQSIVNAAQGVDIMIHEATFESGLEELAISKGHSSVQHAIDIAKAAKVKYLILNHFSQRYNFIPPSIAFTNEFHIIPTWDHMQIDTRYAPIMPSLLSLLAETGVEDE